MSDNEEYCEPYCFDCNKPTVDYLVCDKCLRERLKNGKQLPPGIIVVYPIEGAV